MTAATLLDRLKRVRQTGSGRWVARCPGHEDRHPSLAVRELDDGRVLIHCFGGCRVEEVLASLQLGFDALFPPRPIGHRGSPERRPFPAADVLRCVGFEALLVAVAASRLASGHALDGADRARLLVAASRIQAAIVESRHG